MKDKYILGQKFRGRSITSQLILIFVGVMMFTILASVLINSLFLEKYYLHNKKNALMDAYTKICDSANHNTLSSQEFEDSMQWCVGTHNLSIVIIRSDFEITNLYSSEAPSQIIKEIQDNILGNGKFENIIEETDEYVILIKNDYRLKMEYIEMWGLLSNGSFFMMRSPIESIRESASIANRFLITTGLVSVFLSAILVHIFTRRITKPILELAQISEKMTSMDFNAKYSGNSTNEIGLLGNNINKLSENLEETITELKEANLELMRDNETKREIDEMRKEFISNVSHELKTPIALIQGYSEGLKEVVDEPEERDYYCDVIIDEASKMNLIVQKLLELTKLEFGSYTVNLEHFDICALIRNYVQSSDILLKQHNITVKVPYGQCMVWADELMIDSVFDNFFSNAVIHCRESAEKRIDVSIEMQENVVRVFVFNTGELIPEESINHIWDKFYKIDKARTRRYGGSGVGLSVVKAVMEAHKQNYGVENRENGVCFWFDLDTTNR